MKYEQKPNTGSLFKAEKKSDKHPDLTGTIKLDDGEYYVSAWKKQGQKGDFLSLSLKKKEAIVKRTLADSDTNFSPGYKPDSFTNDLPF